MHQSVKKVPTKAGESMSNTKQNKESELIVQDLVLGLLGKPAQFYGTTVINVFEDKWRVNVWTQHWSSVRVTPVNKISHSFFLKIQNGEIVHSNPPIIPVEEEDGV